MYPHLNYVEITSPSGRDYGLYRIMPTETIKSDGDNSITYTCEHVFATLLDDVIDGYMQFMVSSPSITRAFLTCKETPRWVLGQCDFNNYFEYSFENENGLLAPILSIPMPFNEAYEFTFDTTVYPWVLLNLKTVSDVVKAEIRWGKDMIEFNKISDPTNIVNYIIPKGSGEGVNQLDVARINSGKKVY